jgi:hypothetical protein
MGVHPVKRQTGLVGTRRITGNEKKIREWNVKIKKIEMMRLELGAPVLRQALPAIDGPALGRLEGDFAFLTTV